MTVRVLSFSSALVAAALAAGPAAADKIKNPMAVFNGLDKITGRIISFEVAIDETVQFGALQVTPRVCYTRPPTEAPNTTTFIEVEETTFDNESKRIFSGWMYAASPGLHGIEHAVYDVWLTACKGGTDIIVEAKEVETIEDPLKDLAEQRERDPAGRQRRQAQPGQPGQSGQPGQPTSRQRVDVPPQGVPQQGQPQQRYFPQNERPVAQERRQPKTFFDALFGR